MAQYGFGVGTLNLLPVSDDTGALTNQTPVQVGLLKDISFDISFTSKQLMGANQFPVDIARAEGKITGKTKIAQIFAATLGSVLGVTPSAGVTYDVHDPVTAGALTLTAAGVGTNKVFGEDLGVWDDTAKKWLSRGAAAASGIYSVNVSTGVYTFVAPDSTHQLQLNYTIVDTNTGVGFTSTLVNKLQGSGVLYSVTAFNSFRGKKLGVKLYAVTIPKLGLALKQGDYTDIDLDFEAFADQSSVPNKVLSIFSTE